MKNIDKGKPVNNKKPLELGELEEKTTRISLDIPKSLHKKIKLKAVQEEQDMKNVLIALIEREYK